MSNVPQEIKDEVTRLYRLGELQVLDEEFLSHCSALLQVVAYEDKFFRTTKYDNLPELYIEEVVLRERTISTWCSV